MSELSNEVTEIGNSELNNDSKDINNDDEILDYEDDDYVKENTNNDNDIIDTDLEEEYIQTEPGKSIIENDKIEILDEQINDQQPPSNNNLENHVELDYDDVDNDKEESANETNDLRHDVEELKNDLEEHGGTDFRSDSRTEEKRDERSNNDNKRDERSSNANNKDDRFQAASESNEIRNKVQNDKNQDTYINNEIGGQVDEIFQSARDSNDITDDVEDKIVDNKLGDDINEVVHMNNNKLDKDADIEANKNDNRKKLAEETNCIRNEVIEDREREKDRKYVEDSGERAIEGLEEAKEVVDERAENSDVRYKASNELNLARDKIMANPEVDAFNNELEEKESNTESNNEGDVEFEDAIDALRKDQTDSEFNIPIHLNYQNSTHPLFPTGSETSTIFDDISDIHISIEDLFATLRSSRLDFDFQVCDEIVLSFPQLGKCKITEDNVYCKDLTISDFIDLFKRLCKCTKDESKIPKSINLEISTQPRFITKFNSLVENLENNGGFESIEFEEIQSETKKRKLGD
ncbi:unnamed protein product [Candida verbasci]|uniref:Uncharacterized protein n=1 Tax=Candida verbasci TaxID=1227364 RepID=A0A9W4TUW3_9ASCO|nr:unnamed protein product [Candida verbasci]